MTSDFNSQILRAIDNEWIPTGKKGGRFEFFKVRIYGSLHFVKRISPEYDGDLLSAESLRKEFAIGYPLNHPNIVRYLQFDGMAVYEEYIDGETLRALIERNDKRLKNKEFVRKICVQTLEALKYIHQQGILHLDLKPENIMITRVGEEVKIIDFGCSINASNDSVPGFTQEYMAPEQLNSEVNTYTDIYQLGMIMKELVEIAGTKKQWKNFIKKATAGIPANRFRNDEEALGSIPASFRGKFVIIEAIMLILITGALVSVIIKNKAGLNYPLDQQSETIKEQRLVESDISPDSIRLQETKPEKLPRDVRYEPSEAEIERMLYKKIYHQLDVLYGAKVYPMYEKMMADSVYRWQIGSETEFRSAMRDARNKMLIFGDELSKENPGYENYINDQVMRAIEIKNYRMLENLYPTEIENQDESQEMADTVEAAVEILL